MTTMPLFEPATLHRDGTGGYTAHDGRFTVQPILVDLPRSTRKEWQVTDTQPHRTYSMLLVGTRRAYSLREARELIASAAMRERRLQSCGQPDIHDPHPWDHAQLRAVCTGTPA